jgi:hypothetical protein
MKTTIEIADDLLGKAQSLAKSRRTTLRAITEEGLRLVLEKQGNASANLPPLVTVRGKGLTPEFKRASWEKLRDEIYKGRGA